MNVMFDTNASQIIDELRMVMDMKFPHKKAACEAFLNRLSFEMVLTPRYVDPSIYPRTRDKSDYPILASAIIADVDAFITETHKRKPRDSSRG